MSSWVTIKHQFNDGEGEKLTIEVNEYGGIVLEAKKGVFFESEEDFLHFLEHLTNKAETLFEEITS